ncbi:DUF2184 domain-containing protein [Novosphingobium olei]|uniref:DUF2184 domain-containing protein n=1 Tax=Novosphingobium olei TaxID=2728851 RepID=A0A7Y0BNZ3_9SPHN|nr:DUF2184 domain-containing protein [Novosphingobium olei]NML93798.1 DUF2184 domain-containing protein [Novosphingobium olei]
MLTARLAEHRARLAAGGIELPMGMDYLPKEWRNTGNGMSLAMDAQPTLATAPNIGVPALFTQYISPEIISVIFQPTQAAEFYGEEKMGDWTTDTASFPLTEVTGFVSAYGDFNQNGKSGANANWVSRQSFHFQTFTRWGERELARYGEARIDWASLQSEASSETLARALNASYFYGISGLKLYGGLNDPALPATIQPVTKVAGGYTWANATVLEIYNDFLKCYQAIQTAMPALVNMSSPFDVSIPNTVEPYLAKTNDFGKTVKEILQQSFPNLNFTVVPENATGSGNLMQFKLREVNRKPVTKAAFTEKMRVHPVLTMASGWEQKKSAGTWGTVIRFPYAIVQMLGI